LEGLTAVIVTGATPTYLLTLPPSVDSFPAEKAIKEKLFFIIIKH
jgi:hypothetical protein